VCAAKQRTLKKSDHLIFGTDIMAQALYRKWRPHRWEEVVGQEHIIQTLRNAVTSERVAHAYLFAGPRGTGKTTTARLLAKAVNCQAEDLSARPCDACEYCQAVNAGRFMDLIEIDAASNTSVEDVRSLREKINFSPNQGRYKVYIIDEVHMLSTAAFNALLKTLEEPPSHAIFVLATTEIHKIPATVLSRCQRHEFRRIPVSEMVKHLKEMASTEKLKVDEEALTLVARQATGSLRDAISLLDQLASMGKKISLEMAQSVMGTAPNQAVLEIIEALIARQSAAGLERIHQALDAGSDPRQFARQVVDYLRGLLLVRMENASQVDATAETRAQMARHAQQLDVAELLRLIQLFTRAANEARSAWQPSLPLEMAFAEALGEDRQPDTGPAPAAQAARKTASQASTASAGSTSAAAASATEAEQEAAGGLTVGMINDHMRQVLALLHRTNYSTAEALLRSAHLMGVRNGIVFLGLSEVLKSKMEKEDTLGIVQRAFEQVLKMDVPLQCVPYKGKAGALPPDIDSDGMVATALRDLGGEIVDVQ